MGQSLKALLAEMRRRNVFRVAGTYTVVSWIMVQIASITTTSFGAPDWVMKMIIVTLLIGFPVAIVFAWAFEIAPEGIKLTDSVHDDENISFQTAQKLDLAILAGIIIVAGLMIFTYVSPSKLSPESLSSQNETVNLPPGSAIRPSAPPEIQTIAQATSSDANSIDNGEQSIAVLPFADFSANQDQDYFAKGISEELLNVLAQIDGLRVASRTSAFAFNQQDKSIREISQALNVAHVLEGSIRKAGDTLRITAQLINTANDEHLWSETYDRPLSAQNIFSVQDEIAAAIVKELKGRLSFQPKGTSGRTVSLKAYELYLKGLENANKRLPAPLNKAITSFKDVIALDPNFPQAYSGLADSYMFSYIYGGQDRETVMREARQNIDRALSLSPNSAEALTSAAMYEIMFDDSVNQAKAIDFATRAIEANPNYSVAYHRLGQAHAKQSDYEKGLEAFKKARELDPLSPSILNNVARLQRLLGDWESAKTTSLDNMRWNPNQPAGYIAVAVIAFDQANFAESHSVAKDAQALNPADPTPNLLLKEIYLNAKMFEQAKAIIVNDAVYPGVNEGALAIEAIETGQTKEVKRLIAAIEDDNLDHTEDLQRAARLYTFIGEVEKALTLYETVLETGEYDEKNADIDNILVLANASAILTRMGHPKAPLYRAKLEQYFIGKTANDFARQNELWAGASYMAMGKNPESAYPWIDRMIDLGQADILLREIAFDNLRGSEAFTQREVRMEKNRSDLRNALLAQRASPKENWLPF